MEERDGQHIGVVEKAFEKCVPPFSMMCRVLFMACIEPGRQQGERERRGGRGGCTRGQEGKSRFKSQQLK